MSPRGFTGIAYTILITVTLALLASCITPSAIVSSTVTEAEVEDAIYTLVNEERQSVGLAALARDSDLDKLARWYSASGFSRNMEQSSDLNYLLCNSWRATFSRGSPELREDTAREQVDYCLENYDLRQAMLRSDPRATGLGVAILGDTVYYVQVFDVLNSVKGDGRPVQLNENAQAEDPSWEL
ncbi:MAG: CAP domain-containing protein, partial [Dehalococcoidia bacterium]